MGTNQNILGFMKQSINEGFLPRSTGLVWATK